MNLNGNAIVWLDTDELSLIFNLKQFTVSELSDLLKVKAMLKSFKQVKVR